MILSMSSQSTSSPNSRLVQRTLDLNYDNRKRANSFKWIVLNSVFLLIFVYDLSHKCPEYTSVLHYVELVLAAVMAANLVQYVIRLLPSRAPKLPLTPEQQKLLGLSNADLGVTTRDQDDYFAIIHATVSGKVSTIPLTIVESTSPEDAPVSERNGWSRSPMNLSVIYKSRVLITDSSFVLNKSNSSHSKVNDTERESWAISDAELSLSPRTWRSPPPSPPSPAPVSSRAPSSSPPPGSPPRTIVLDKPPSLEQFIADQTSLEEYLRRWTERVHAELSPPPPAALARLVPPVYQLAITDTGHRTHEESSEVGGAAGLVWCRLDLDPQRLTQWNQNLRLWIQVTILSRLVREIRAADETLTRLALFEAGALRERRVPPARLRAAPGTAQLLPFLEPFPDQRYLVRRITELAAGGCMSAYKWNGGGSEWDASKPTDAELVLHLFATYLDGQLPGGANARPFSGAHMVERSAARGPDTLAIVVVSTRPPHYALALGEETLEVGRGRNNLLHTLLLFLAAAARRDPPALARTHLGRAGLNMLWIIGR